jgi:hypothetical protein
MRASVIVNSFLNAVIASAAAVPPTLWEPTAHEAAGQKWQIVLSQTVRMSTQLQPTAAMIWDLDLFETDASTIASLKAQGKTVICYFSSGTSEPNRPDLSGLSSSDYGAGLPDWPGEKWLNLRSDRVWNVMAGRIELASQKGCDAIDPDNIDGYSNQNGGGFYPALTTSDSVKFLKKMASLARSYGMSTGIKNAMDILGAVQSDVQFAVNEECIANEECDVYDSFVGSGKPVYHIEYGSGSQARSFCSNSNLNTVVKNLDLDGWVHYCDGTEYTTPTS